MIIIKHVANGYDYCKRILLCSLDLCIKQCRQGDTVPIRGNRPHLVERKQLVSKVIEPLTSVTVSEGLELARAVSKRGQAELGVLW